VSVLYLLSGLGSAAARISVEDLAYVEDLVPPGVPDPPYNPDSPRYSERALAWAAVRVHPGSAEAGVT